MTEPDERDDDTQTIPVYTRGQWSTTPAITSTNDTATPAGYDKFTDFNTGTNGPLSIDVWSSQTRSPAFLLHINSPLASRTVGAGDIVDVMDLLGRWAPALQTAAISYLLQHAGYEFVDGARTNPFSAIAALIAEGNEQREERKHRLRVEAQERKARLRPPSPRPHSTPE